MTATGESASLIAIALPPFPWCLVDISFGRTNMKGKGNPRLRRDATELTCQRYCGVIEPNQRVITDLSVGFRAGIDLGQLSRRKRYGDLCGRV